MKMILFILAMVLFIVAVIYGGVTHDYALECIMLIGVIVLLNIKSYMEEEL